jgi:hypothetical protein
MFSSVSRSSETRRCSSSVGSGTGSSSPWTSRRSAIVTAWLATTTRPLSVSSVGWRALTSAHASVTSNTTCEAYSSSV